MTHPTRYINRRKRIAAYVCFQYLDRFCRLARKRQGQGESRIGEIGIECEGSLEFGDGGIVLALER